MPKQGGILSCFVSGAGYLYKSEEHLGRWVQREPWMNILPCTWAFKCKHYPDGMIKYGSASEVTSTRVGWISLTFAPVLNLTTFRLMLILSMKFDLNTRQVDSMAAFFQPQLIVIPNLISWQMRRSTKAASMLKCPKVLKRLANIYATKVFEWTKASSQNWKAKFEKIGFMNSDLNAFLFTSDTVTCIFFVDNTLSLLSCEFLRLMRS